MSMHKSHCALKADKQSQKNSHMEKGEVTYVHFHSAFIEYMINWQVWTFTQALVSFQTTCVAVVLNLKPTTEMEFKALSSVLNKRKHRSA